MTEREKLTHICKELDYCICSSQALEPEDFCPKHGMREYPSRCVICGRFIRSIK